MLTRVRGLKLLALLTVLTIALAVAAACGGEENPQPPSTGTPPPTMEARPTLTPGAYTPPAGSANLLGNPGFEEGTKYWYSLSTEETLVTTDVVHSGQGSAYLKMRDAAETQGTKAFNLVQDVAPTQFPELISGYYRVDNWKRGTEKQYLQFDVVVFAPTNLGDQYPNYQMLYPLAGTAEEPFLVKNGFFVFLGREDPRQGEWVYFEANIKKDFQEKWGAVPEGYSEIRVMFELRYNDKQSGMPAEADVYYDDLYMGPADANPNKP